MIGLPRRELQGGDDVAWFQVRKVLQDLFPGAPGGEQLQHVGHSHAKAAQTGSAPMTSGSTVIRWSSEPRRSTSILFSLGLGVPSEALV